VHKSCCQERLTRRIALSTLGSSLSWGANLW